MPPDPTNAVADDERAALLGQRLFFDARYSGPLAVSSDLGQQGEEGRVSCVSCHSSEVMSDDRSMPDNVSLGVNFHSRNAPAIVNSSFYPWTNWGGRFGAQWELPPVVAEAGVIMNSSRLRIAHHIFDHYRAEYEAIFGPMEPAIGTDLMRFPASGRPNAMTPGAWESMTPADQTIVNRIWIVTVSGPASLPASAPPSDAPASARPASEPASGLTPASTPESEPGLTPASTPESGPASERAASGSVLASTTGTASGGAAASPGGGPPSGAPGLSPPQAPRATRARAATE